MRNINILDINSYSRWDDFVSRHPLGTIYHTTAWQRVITDAYGHQPLYVILENDDNTIIGGLPLFLVNSKFSQKKLSALPCTQCCNPLVRNQSEYERILNFAVKLFKGYNCKYIEIKTSERFQLNTDNFSTAVTNFSTYQLDLKPAVEDIRKNFHKSCIQRVINRSYKNSLELLIAKSEKDVKEFYKLYLHMRKRYGLLPQPLKFFLMIWRNLSESNYIDIFLCKKNGEIASAIMILKFLDDVIYEYGASKPEMLKYGVSHFLLWEAIKYARDQGYMQFDFGRTSNDNNGLAQFKARWGTEKVILPYLFIPKADHVTMVHQNKSLKKLMGLTIRNLPAFSGQLIGWALYKHLL